MKKHVTLVGAIQICFSILGLIGALVVFFALHFGALPCLKSRVLPCPRGSGWKAVSGEKPVRFP